MSTLEWPRITDNLTLSPRLPENKPLPNHGELDEPLPVFLEFLEEVLPDQDKEPLETCAERDECSLPLESGEDGTDESMLRRRDTLSPQLSLELLSPLLSWPEDIESHKFPRFLSLSTTLLLIP